MRILLLNPPFEEKVFREGRCEQKVDLFRTGYPPMTLAYIAGMLKDKCEVKIIDCVGEDINLKDLIPIYTSFNPDKVLVNTSTPTFDYDIKVVKELYETKKSEIFLFGIHVTYFAKEIESNSDLSNFKVIQGEPEEYVATLIGEKFDFENIKLPAWDLIDLSRYKLPLRNKHFVLVNPSRGCPHNCTFCTNPFFYKRKYRLRPVNKIIEELEYIKSIGINDVIFFSDTFTLDNNWVKELCNQMLKKNLNIKWLCNSRVDTIDYETLKLMKKAGLWMMSFGIESGKQEILNRANKNIKLEQVEIAVNAAKKAGILTFGHFILGLPGETEETLIETIKFSKSLGLDFAMFYIATPLPASELYEIYIKQKGKKHNKKWGAFEYSNQVFDSELDLKKWQSKAYKEFYFSNIFIRLTRIIRILGLRTIPSLAYSSIKTGIEIFRK